MRFLQPARPIATTRAREGHALGPIDRNLKRIREIADSARTYREVQGRPLGYVRRLEAWLSNSLNPLVRPPCVQSKGGSQNCRQQENAIRLGYS
jgi:hypothetical protein